MRKTRRTIVKTMSMTAIVVAGLTMAIAAGCSAEKSGDESVRASVAPKTDATPQASIQEPETVNASNSKVEKTDAEWKKILSPEQYAILRQKGTERAFSGKYWNTKTPGVYACAGCGEVLFDSSSKFDSGCGWPSFDKAMADGKIAEHTDTTHGMVRTEVVCAKCGGHLGHVFEDGPTDTGLRYCINSASIDLKQKNDQGTQEKGKPQN